MISLKINGFNVETPEGSTVLQAAASIGVTIPTLCYHKDLSVYGGCRLCVVEVRGARLPMTSCSLPAVPGMEIQTQTPNIIRYRQAVLRMLLSNYYDAGYKRYNGKFDIDQDNELAFWAREYNVDIRQAMAKKPLYPIDSDPNPFVWVDKNKCIQCTRCVRACGEIPGRFVWTQAYRGYQARIVAGADSTMLASRCESCGACVVYCPTGALDNKMSVSAGRADRVVQTTCTYCGVGCQLDLNIKDDVSGGRVLRVTSTGNPNIQSVNKLHLCLKGRYGYEFIHDARRHTQPLVRQYLLDGAARPKNRGRLVPTDWDTALKIAADGLRKAGDGRVGLLASGKLTNEENYLLNKLARQVLRTNQIDCCANIYSSSLVNGLAETLGLTAMSNSFDDIAAQARSLLVIGANLTESHPIFGALVRQAIMHHQLRMVVASPDFINTAEYAALSLYHHPNTEAALVNGLMHIILEKGWQDQAAIDRDPDGFARAKEVLLGYTPRRVSEITGLTVDSLYLAAAILANNRPASVVWSLGIANPATGRGTIQALANLQLLLGNLDVPGGGVNPLRSQNNIQGACDMGAHPAWLPGYQPVTEAASRERFEQAWGGPLPEAPGQTAPEILAAAGEGHLKALYILGEEILNATPEAARIRRNLEQCEFVILQETAASETTRYADVVLPGVSFAEKTGTFTSAERRIQLVRQAIEPIGQARPDWQIITGLAQRLIGDHETAAEMKGVVHPRIAAFSSWKYADPAEIMSEIIVLAPIYAGVSYESLAHGKRVQWPVDAPGQPGSPLLQAGTFSGGQVRWALPEPVPQFEPA